MFKHPTPKEFAAIQQDRFSKAIEGEELNAKLKAQILYPETSKLYNNGFEQGFEMGRLIEQLESNK